MSGAEAGQDLTGVDLDNLVKELQNVQLIVFVFDEISTCGVASLEVVSRRMREWCGGGTSKGSRLPRWGRSEELVSCLWAILCRSRCSQHKLDGGHASCGELG